MARVTGIPVRIDYRWFLVFALSAWVIAVMFRERTPMTHNVQLSTGAAWVAGVLTTFGLFLSIFGHELSHALLARAEGIESEEIVLHPFGGLTRLRREPDNPRAEFRIAIAGPSASFMIGVLSFVGYYFSQLAGLDALGAALTIVGYWNFTIAASNLLPGYPLDGGRVLRAFLWKRTGQLDDATRIAGLGGQLIGGALGVFGVWFYWRARDPFMGLWLVVVGLFLFDAARAVTRRRKSLRTAGDAMTAAVAVEPDSTVGHFVDHVLTLHRQEAFAVARGGRLHGILTLKDLKALPRERWHQTRVREVMRPVSEELFVPPAAPLARAERLLNENGAGALAGVAAPGPHGGHRQPAPLKRRAGVKA